MANMTGEEALRIPGFINSDHPRLVAFFLGGSSPVSSPLRVFPCPQPEWCNCGVCVPMDNPKMGVCCNSSKYKCVVQDPTFTDICLKSKVVEICGIDNYSEQFHDNPRYDSGKFRNQAYSLFCTLAVRATGSGPETSRAIVCC